MKPLQHNQIRWRLMARAGHRSMDTTRQYLKLAGVLFPDQAEALDRMLGG